MLLIENPGTETRSVFYLWEVDQFHSGTEPLGHR